METILIKNGHVVDPAQGIDGPMNVLIQNGKIADVTAGLPQADRVLDAAGKIVCPGFIDIHMHEDVYDPATDSIRYDIALSALRMGVTLDVGGNCGDNEYPPDRYLDLLDRDGAPTNMALLAGHTTMRNMDGVKDKYKPVDEATVRAMVKTCEKYLDAGCLGVSFGAKYVPGAGLEELLPLVRLCRKDDKLAASHVRQDVDGVFDAAAELAAMGREGVKVQFSHIGSMGGYGQMARLLEDIQGYRAAGVDMLCDCYPYDAFSTDIGETTYDEGFLDRYQAGYDSILLLNGKYAGRRCTEAIFREVRRTEPHTGTVGYFMRPEEVSLALMSPLVMLGSDSNRTDGRGHPRASGAFAKFIREYIASGRLSLTEGVKKMSAMAAERLCLPHKGNLRPGSDADITVFDLARVTDRATYDDGQIPAEGFAWVLIGGQIALENDEIVNARLGRAVRR